MATTSAEAPVTGAAHAQLLSRLPFFVGVPPEELAAFAGTMLIRECAPGTDIVVQRQYGHAMFVLLHGAVSVHTIGHDDVSVTLGRFDRSGDYFGEAVLLGRGERSATVTAQTAVVLLEIEKHRFDLFTRRHKQVRDHLEGVYHARAIATYLRTHRYLALLDDASRIELGANATLRLYQRGDVITKRGEAADTVIVVKDGVVKAMRTNSAGAVSILAYFNTHDLVGVSDGAKRDFDVEAVGQCEIIFLPRVAFTRVMARNLEVASHFGKDDMHRKAAMAAAGKTVVAAAQAFLSAGVEVESLLVINLDRCVRCGNCVRACHARHTYTRLDRRGPIFRRRAQQAETGKHEHVMLPSSCRHCRDPECMIGCPTGAIQRFPDGDVDINDNCIGCENCARKCPYGNITMRPLEEHERPSPEVTKRAIKCNLCRGHSYSNCVHECPRGAILRVDPLRYFEELALVMEAEQQDALKWSRDEARQVGMLGTKQRIQPRSTRFIATSLVLGLVAILGVLGAVVVAKGPLRGGSPIGLVLGVAAAGCLFGAASLGVRKRIRDAAIGGLEVWTQFHMVLGGVGFVTAVAHAGFRVTGVFTTLLLLVFAFEVVTGAVGQILYMTVPHTLTRLERHGLARLVEDLLGEEKTIMQSIDELVATLPGRKWRDLRSRVEAAAGTLRDRMKPSYDATKLVIAAKTQLAKTDLAADERSTIERVIESRCRLVDVRAQLVLHRRLKSWLVVHVATASALVVLLAFHVVTALTLVP